MDYQNCRAPVGPTNGPFTALSDSQQALIEGKLFTASLVLFQKACFSYTSGMIFSMQQEISATLMSATVKYPVANYLSPQNLFRYSDLTTAFSLAGGRSSSHLGFQNKITKSLTPSMITPSIASTMASSLGFFPRASLPSCLGAVLKMYLMMAVDSVSLKSPSMRQGRLGKSNPSYFLSLSNHCSFSTYF